MTLGNRGPDELPLRIFGKHKILLGEKGMILPTEKRDSNA
jgi:hypothetical protein